MIKAITGTKDILPVDVAKWQFLEKLLRETFQLFNYKEIRTPIFEETSLFARGIGEETDIVSKEMYTFKDRSETSITLRPENTAGVVRSFIEQSLGAQQSLNKLYYIGPMFRQERPQAGRLRQFHQFGAEALGSTSPLLDAEMIQVAYHILKKLGLKNLVVKVNSLGIPEVRENYKNILRDFLKDKINQLSEDSRKRFETNILRIFDSKIEVDQLIMKDAPLLIDYLDEQSKKDFDVVKDYLIKVGIPFEVDPALVRGLDYYTKTTFEIVSGSVGSQSALCGGGRYDLLVEELGGKPTPGVGFAAGMERILLACENEKSLILSPEKLDFYIVKLNPVKLRADGMRIYMESEPLGDEYVLLVQEIATHLRKMNYSVDYDFHDRSIKAQKREAYKFNTRFLLTIGDIDVGYIKFFDMQKKIEKRIKIKTLLSKDNFELWLKKNIKLKDRIYEREKDFQELKEQYPQKSKFIDLLVLLSLGHSLKESSQKLSVDIKEATRIWNIYKNSGLSELLKESIEN